VSLACLHGTFSIYIDHVDLEIEVPSFFAWHGESRPGIGIANMWMELLHLETPLAL